MEIKPIKVNEAQTSILFDAGTAEIVSSGDGIVFAAMEDGMICALAVIAKAENKNAYIIYHLSEGDKGKKEHTVALLEYIEKVCRDVNVKYLYANISGDVFEVLYLYSILSDSGYMTIDTKEHVLTYYIQDLLDTEFAQKSKNILKAIGNIKKVDELSDRQIYNFTKKLSNAAGVDRKIKMPTSEYARFFMVDNEIKGCFDISMESQGVLYLSNVFIENGDDTRYAGAAMFAEILQIAESMEYLDAVLVMKTDSEARYNSILAAFGEAESDEIIYESVKVLEV